MKILHVLNSNQFSGAENVVCQIISMYKNDDNVEMAYASPNGQIKDALKERNIEFYPMNKMSVLELKRVINEYKPDIIHAHDMKASFFAAITAKKIPVVSHIHNNNFDSRGISLKSILYYFAAKKAKKILWVSESTMKGYRFQSAIDNKSVILCNIIDEKQLYCKMAEDKKQYNYDVVFLGRITYLKNPQRVIHVLNKVIEKNKEIRAAIIGIGELENEVKQLITDNKLGNRIDMIGFQSNPYKILHNAKVMLMTSRTEGLPMCCLEALSLGTPVVSTPVGGIGELIKDGKNGYLSDDDNVLAQRICDIVSDEALYEKLSENAKTTAHEINNVEQYKKVISTVYQKAVMI